MHLLLLLLTASSAHAATIAVTGQVLDPSGRPVPNATVSLATPAQTRIATARADAEGRFRVQVPARGSYVAAAKADGFAETRQAVTTEREAALTLRIEAATTLTVTAEANRALDPDESPNLATVISREKLARVTVLSEALEGETGAHQLRTSPTLGAVFVRGLTGKNTVVFRDGVRYTTSAQRGGISTFLNLVPPQSLESVEVLRGPSSAQYGSDAIAGTVALVSKIPAGQLQAEADAHYESPMHAFGSTASLAHSRFTASLFGLRSNTWRTGQGVDSHAAVTRFLGLPSAAIGQQRLPDTAFTAYGGTLHGQLAEGPRGLWIVHYERSQQDGGKRYDQLLGGDGNWIADLRNLQLDFGYLRYQRFQLGPLDQVSLTGSYNAQREERVNQGGQGNPAAAITHQYEKTKVVGGQALVEKALEGVDLTAGAEFYAERIAAPSFSFNPATQEVALVRPRIPDGARYRSYGGFGQANRQTARLRLAGALRYGGAAYRSRAANSPLVAGRPLWPDDSLHAAAWSGRAGLVLWASQALNFHASYSSGYRVPNVTDLGSIGLQGNGLFEAAFADLAGTGALVGDRAGDLAVSTGNPAARLRPERTHSVDSGVRLRTNRLQASFTAFHLTLRDTIISQTLILPAGAVGRTLGDQTITRQLASGAVFVPLSASPVLVRANLGGARLRGVEQSLRLRLAADWSFSQNLTYTHAEDSRTGLPPDIEPGVPPLTVNPSIAWRPRRLWLEAYATLAARQDRLSTLALSDRRIGNPRSRATIQSFFHNGARTRGLVAAGVLLPTGETLAQVQSRVLGTANSAPQFAAIPGFAVFGVRGGLALGPRTDLAIDLANLTDKNYRGIGWGIDGPGRGVSLRLRQRW